MSRLSSYLWILTITLFTFSSPLQAAVLAGVGKSDLTPPIETPSAGYDKRQGQGMKGIHDPLTATALILDNCEKKIIFCSVDHLGFTYEMVQAITQQIQKMPGFENSELYLGSTHTHSGGGAYLNIEGLGPLLAGKYDPQIEELYIQRTIKAIAQAAANMQPAKVGIGHGKVEDALCVYRSQWPVDIEPLSDLHVIQVNTQEGAPLAILFNYALHPTYLKADNWLFSADFVGYAREELKALLGSQIEVLYFNGAQAEIIPCPTLGKDEYLKAQHAGHTLAKNVSNLLKEVTAQDELHIASFKDTYQFKPQKTPAGLVMPMTNYKSELNLLVLNHQHAFLTIPGELSCVYAKKFQEQHQSLHVPHLSILGLTNDAHGYIITPDAWRHGTQESHLSFGGEYYGDLIEEKVAELFKRLSKEP